MNSDNLVWIVVVAVVIVLVIFLVLYNDHEDGEEEPDFKYVWWIVGIVVAVLVLAWYFGSPALGIKGQQHSMKKSKKYSGRGSLSPPRSSANTRTRRSASVASSGGSLRSGSISRSTQSAPRSSSMRRTSRSSLSSLSP